MSNSEYVELCVRFFVTFYSVPITTFGIEDDRIMRRGLVFVILQLFFRFFPFILISFAVHSRILCATKEISSR